MALLGSDYHRVGWAHNEYVADVVQFEVMELELRSRILETYATVDASPSRAAVNGIAHDVDPEAFGIRAYLVSQTTHAALLVRQVLGREAGFGDAVDRLWTK